MLINNPGGVVDSVVAGTNVTVDSTDPKNPVVSATGGGGTSNPAKTGSNMTFFRNGTISNGQQNTNAWFAHLITVPFACDLAATVNVVAGTALSKMAVALYDADPATGVPLNRMYLFDELDLSAAGVVSSAPVGVAAGQYWVVNTISVSSAAGGLKQLAATNDFLNTWVNAAGAFVARSVVGAAYVYPPAAVSALAWGNDNSTPDICVAFKIS